MIKEIAHAKINLALEVMEKNNGYHKVNNLMIPIDIYDELEIEKSDSVSIYNDPFPNDNIITKAANLFFEYTKINGGAYFKLKKNIPHAAGLAGGSTDAAAALRGLNKLYATNLTIDELKELASKLGSDVPFFIEEKIALCTGRGEIINNLDSNLKPFKLLLIKPTSGLSTKDVYMNYKYEGNSKEIEINNLIKAIKNNDFDLLKENIFNDLDSVALNLNKEMNNIFMKISLLGLKPYVSGSGPTMFVLDYNLEELEIIKNMLEEDIFIKECNTL